MWRGRQKSEQDVTLQSLRGTEEGPLHHLWLGLPAGAGVLAETKK